ncbi:MAG: AAA family ATPase [Herpetosiphon sp.]|nr:AAA family ATPase [Herpetosiphon sp.]
MHLIIILGLPGGGKTMFAQQLGAALHLPVQHKDTIKELLCDTLGCPDLQRSRELGKMSMILLYQWAETMLAAGQSCIIESTFHPQYSTADIAVLQAKYPFEPVQIRCHTTHDILIERIQQRLALGQRHAGHFDDARSQNEGLAAGLDEFLAIGGAHIEFDTTHVERDGYAEIIRKTKNIIDNE